MHKGSRWTSLIGIAIALISVKILRQQTELSGLLTILIALGISVLVTATCVFIAGAMGFTNIDDKNGSHKSNSE